MGDTWEQFEKGGSAPPASGSSGSEVPIIAFVVSPDPIQSGLGAIAVFQVQLAVNAGSAGQMVDILAGGSPVLTLLVAAGTAFGQSSIDVSSIGPGSYPLTATAGGVTMTATMNVI